VTQELREMKLEAQAEAASEQMSVIEVFKDKSIRWQLISIITLQVTQQLCGINAVSEILIIGSDGALCTIFAQLLMNCLLVKSRSNFGNKLDRPC